MPGTVVLVRRSSVLHGDSRLGRPGSTRRPTPSITHDDVTRLEPKSHRTIGTLSKSTTFIDRPGGTSRQLVLGIKNGNNTKNRLSLGSSEDRTILMSS